jgi:hypothetical protein
MARKKLSRRKKGTPRQPSIKRGRHQVNILMTPELKDQLLAAATKNNRTISSEGAALVETAIAIKGLLAAIGARADEIAKGNLEAEMRRAGYAPLRDGTGNVTWLPPGHPANPGRSGFEAWTAAELEAQATGSDEEIERRNRARLEANDQQPPTFDTDAARRGLEEIEEISNAPKKDDAA